MCRQSIMNRRRDGYSGFSRTNCSRLFRTSRISIFSADVFESLHSSTLQSVSKRLFSLPWLVLGDYVRGFASGKFVDIFTAAFDYSLTEQALFTSNAILTSFGSVTLW